MHVCLWLKTPVKPDFVRPQYRNKGALRWTKSPAKATSTVTSVSCTVCFGLDARPNSTNTEPRKSALKGKVPYSTLHREWSFQVGLLYLGGDFEALARSKGEVRIRVEGFMKQL